jgi:hypothetical protein
MNPSMASSHSRRVVGAGVVGIALLLTVGRGLPAIWRWQSESDDAAATQVQEMARARTTIARARLTRDSLATRQKRFIALAPLLLRGETPAMGGANLASLVATTATAASVRLGPVQVRSDTMGRGVFSRVGVRTEVTGDVRGISTFLSALEHGPTLLAVRELTISQLEPGAPPERAEALHVQLALEALMLAPRRPEAAKTRRQSEPRGKKS